jgi:hypothetical protein
LTKNGLATFSGDFFSQTHLVTLSVSQQRNLGKQKKSATPKKDLKRKANTTKIFTSHFFELLKSVKFECANIQSYCIAQN